MWLDDLLEVLTFTAAVFFIAIGGYGIAKGYTDGGVAIIVGCICILVLLEIVKQCEEDKKHTGES